MTGTGSPEKRYELVERIAVGGMAEVFRAKAYGPHGFEKVLAIKRILPALAADPVFERRFIDEAKLAVSLSHANIVQVLDFSRFGQSLYIVMEFVDGGDLARVLQILREHDRKVPVEVIAHVASELLKGLDYAHRRGVVHRDVSPSNILLSRAGEVKIADFGIAQVVGFEHSRSMRIMGKWRYMSPEQTQGAELDARSDVFSAGSLLFELMTGERLFPGNDAHEIVHHLRTMPLPRPSQLRPDLPPELDAPIAAALERDREKRTITAAQLLDELVEVFYARSLPALPTALARFLEQLDGLAAGHTTSTPGSGSSGPGLLDEIIVSELAPGERRARSSGVRRTAMAMGPPAVAPEDVASDAGRASEHTGSTYIRSVPDHDGTHRWELSQDPGVPPIAVEPRRDLDDDDLIDDGDVTRAVETRPPETPVPILLPDLAEEVAAPPPMMPGPPVSLPPLQHRTPMPPSIGERPVGARSSRRWIAAGAAAAAVVVVIVAATELSGPRRLVPAPEIASEPVEVVQTAPPALPVAASAPDAAPAAHPTPDAAPDAAPESHDAPESDETPRPEPRERRYAAVDIYSEPWANIYLGKRKVGVAPQRGVRLPYGRHRLKLVNPVLKRTTWVTVTVPSSRPIRVELPAR